MNAVTVVESWIERPLKQFVSDAGAELALLLHPSGQVLAQHGFARAVDVMSACALAAGIHASAGELGKLLDGQPFRGLHHVGRERQIFLAEALWPRGVYIFLTVFGSESSLGLVRLRVRKASQELAVTIDVMVKKSAAGSGQPSVFSEITDDDIDNLFND